MFSRFSGKTSRIEPSEGYVRPRSGSLPSPAQSTIILEPPVSVEQRNRSVRELFRIRSRHSSFVATSFSCFQGIAVTIWSHADTLWAKVWSWTFLLLVSYTMLLTILYDQGIKWDGAIFRLLAMLIIAHFVGSLTHRFLNLPPLLGMLVTGCVLRNVGFYDPNTGKYCLITCTLKHMSTTVSMVKTGIRLVPDAIYIAMKNDRGLQLTGLGLGPSLIEAMTTAVVAFVTLGYPPIWAVCLGFLLCPNSPSVITPPMVELMDLGYGEDKHIGTLVHGAAGLDVAFSVSIFDVCLGLLYHVQKLKPAITVGLGSLDICADLLGGSIFGVFAGLLPIQDNWLGVYKRVAAVTMGGMLAILAGPHLGMPGTGPLSCICTAFIASMMWKLQNPLSCKRSVKDVVQGFWVLLCPILFAFAGSDLDLKSPYITAKTWCAIVGIVMLSVVMRFLGCFLVLWGSGFNFKEKLFVGLIFQGKATNQAALAPQILYRVLDSKLEDKSEDLKIAHQSLALAATSILICTPLSHLGAKLGGPWLLSRSRRRDRSPEQTRDNIPKQPA